MATTQYIGARYVPLFSEPLDWDINKAYESLTIVYTAGNSYTSKQAVPAGIDITNTEYWALTGNYNAQIEQYRKETQAVKDEYDGVVSDLAAETTRAKAAESELATGVANATKAVADEKTRAEAAEAQITTDYETAVNTEKTRAEAAEAAETARAKNAENELATGVSNAITAVNTEKERAEAAEKKLNGNLDNANIVLIGDSYLRGVGTASLQGWGYYFEKCLASTANVTSFGNSGAGFVAAGHTDPMSGMTFSQQVDYAATQTNADNIDYVIIGGGWNDNAQSYTSVFNATAACVKNAQTKFKNAKIMVVSLSNELHTQTAGYINANIAIFKGAQSAGADTPDMSWLWLKANSDVVSSDKIHPNDVGYEMQGYMIAAALRGSDATPSTHMGAGFTAGDDITSNTFRCAVVDGICYLQGEFTATSWSNNTTLGTLPAAMRPSRAVYELAQFIGTSYKEIVPVYIGTNGIMQPRTPFGGSYPTGSATIYLQHISYPIGIL